MFVNGDSSSLEVLMREALIREGLIFEEQVFIKNQASHYVFDFVVYGESSRIVVECDGPDHNRIEQASFISLDPVTKS